MCKYFQPCYITPKHASDILSDFKKYNSQLTLDDDDAVSARCGSTILIKQVILCTMQKSIPNKIVFHWWPFFVLYDKKYLTAEKGQILVASYLYG